MNNISVLNIYQGTIDTNQLPNSKGEKEEKKKVVGLDKKYTRILDRKKKIKK
jgi:hypothetical protein